MTSNMELSTGFRNPAATEAAVHELIRERWSPRAFSSEPVNSQDLHSLLEAARWAPSSMNEQPWRFVMADRFRDPEAHARVLSTLVPQNAAWAGRAPVLMVAVSKMTHTHNGAPNRHALYDTGAATALLTLQATWHGLSVHQMGGFHADQARKLLGIPEGFEPVAVLAIGHPGDPADLSDNLRTRELAPRQRRPLNELVFNGSWGESPETGKPVTQ